MQPDNRMDLAMYRIARAEETLLSAQRELVAEDYRTANNRAYYAIFHAIRALLALDGVDYKRHSGVLSHFNQHYIKTGMFPVKFSEVVSNASEIRNDSDYDDFYICSKEQTRELVESVQEVVTAIQEYLKKKNTGMQP